MSHNTESACAKNGNYGEKKKKRKPSCPHSRGTTFIEALSTHSAPADLSLFLLTYSTNKMSAGTAPDATATITLDGSPTTVAAIRAMIHRNDAIRMLPEHWLAKCMGGSQWVVQISAGEYACSQRFHDWVIMRTLVIDKDLLTDPLDRKSVV